MPTLWIRFPGRRYHATPWGHHVNEGLVEWPPSPWRLLRALLATGYAKQHWPAEGPPPLARSLIEKLASTAPRYCVPPAVGTHSRHYMPLARFKNGREDTTLVFDTWAQVDDGELGVRWDVALSDDERTLLAELARELGYLGRSESWVDATLADTDNATGFDVFAGEARDCPGAGWEQVALLAPHSAGDYSAWRVGALAEAQAQTGIAPHKPRYTAAEKKKLAAVDQTLPQDLLACLQVDTAWLHRLGWSQPPGSRKLLYWRRSNSLESAAPQPRPAMRRGASVSCMLLALNAASGNLNALPRVERALPQGELLHRGLVANASRLGGHSVVLSGCDEQRKPLATPHQHAHLIHLDLDGDGRLDHVLIWAPMGLDADAQAAVRATRRSYTKGGVGALHLALAGSGDWAHFAALPDPFGPRLRALLGNGDDGAIRWRSLTPFVPPRHLKAQGRNNLLGQINAELASRNLPDTLSCQIFDSHTDDVARRARHFKRVRGQGTPPPQDVGFVLELEFAAPVRGPIALGYGSHYGLGTFVAIE